MQKLHHEQAKRLKFFLEMLRGTTQWIALWAAVQISELTSHIFWRRLQRSFTFQIVDII